jgi:hypothetical protein
MKRRRRLIEVTEELEAIRSAADTPPPIPAKCDGSEEDAKLDEEDLIGMSAGESRGTVQESGSAPSALDAGDEDITRNEVGTTENNSGLDAFWGMADLNGTLLI